jgi:hypothetical protein
MKVEIAMKRVVYEIPGMQDPTVRRGVEYNAALSLDLYYPAGPDAPRPAVVIVLGYPDVGVSSPFGCQSREMGMFVSWAELFAASGIVGVLYETRHPANDVIAVLSFLRTNAGTLGIDATRIGVWASSGNAPVALSVLMEGRVRCGVLCYGFTLDLNGSTGVAQAAAQYHFANSPAGRGVEDLPYDIPLFIARAGREQFAGLNEALDTFVAAALRCNLPLTLVNHATGPHGFDFADDTEASRKIIRQILMFLRENLEICTPDLFKPAGLAQKNQSRTAE